MAADRLLPQAATTVTPPAPVSSSGAGGARRLSSVRIALADGGATTVHLASYDLARTALRVVRLLRPAPLRAWCAEHAVADALVGGYFVRPDGTPLGELRTGGMARASRSFDAPWHELRACVHVAGGTVTIARRPDLPAAPRGDLLQAGPLLVRDGRAVAGDDEGFSAGRRQFDSDITDGRYPRAALGLTRDGRLLALACDGRADDEAGLSLAELAETMVALGAVSALNLDGGGSTSLVCDGRLRNVPRERHGVALPGGRAVSTALVFARTA
jgi:hypothetical protein